MNRKNRSKNSQNTLFLVRISANDRQKLLLSRSKTETKIRNFDVFGRILLRKKFIRALLKRLSNRFNLQTLQRLPSIHLN